MASDGASFRRKLPLAALNPSALPWTRNMVDGVAESLDRITKLESAVGNLGKNTTSIARQLPYLMGGETLDTGGSGGTSDPDDCSAPVNYATQTPLHIAECDQVDILSYRGQAPDGTYASGSSNRNPEHYRGGVTFNPLDRPVEAGSTPGPRKGQTTWHMTWNVYRGQEESNNLNWAGTSAITINGATSYFTSGPAEGYEGTLDQWRALSFDPVAAYSEPIGQLKFDVLGGTAPTMQVTSTNLPALTRDAVTTAHAPVSLYPYLPNGVTSPDLNGGGAANTNPYIQTNSSVLAGRAPAADYVSKPDGGPENDDGTVNFGDEAGLYFELDTDSSVKSIWYYDGNLATNPPAYGGPSGGS